MASNKLKTPETIVLKGNAEKRKNSLGKSKPGFWSRLINFTAEPPKTVVVEDGIEKLVLISPKTVAAPETVVIKEETQKPVSVSQETIIRKEIVVKPPPVSRETIVREKPIEKPISASQGAILEETVVKPVSIPQKAVVKEKPAEKPTSVSQESVVIKKPVEKTAPVSPVPVIKEAPVEKPISVPPKTTTVVKEKVERKPLTSSEKLKKGLEKTRGRFWSRLKGFFSFRRKIDESVLEELEDILIGADIGAKPVQKLIHELHEAWKSQAITETSQIHDFIKNRLKEDLRSWQTDIHYAPASPTVIMVVGVNGVGKTTAIAKLANILIKDGKKVLVAAGDTFRAAAVDQLDIWSKRIGAEIVKHQTGSDPAAVAYDAIEASIARGIHVVIVDTAGRLHTHENLMNELSKIKRVISKRIPGAPHEVLMVLDATTGQNAISQAKMFKQAVDVTGIFLAKLDGTAKGGIVLGMRNEINIPVKFVGLGETADDIEKFDADTFVNALFE
ncbi:MAG: signal recognition particle-docking protein FtsY [Planctomycetes bacterium]|nr:signal recognition particle-docking protein FtsY [Planctomycetota bacterium]